MQNQQFRVLKNPGLYVQSDEPTAEKYDEIERDTIPLLEKIIETAKDTYKKKAWYTDKRRPSETEKKEYSYGDVKIKVETVPQQKKPAWKDILLHSRSWLGFMDQNYEKFIRKDEKGNDVGEIIVKDNKKYILLDCIVTEIKESIKHIKEGKEGVNQTVSFEAPEHVIKEGLEKVVYSDKRDYSKETEENALDYVKASILRDAIKKNFYNPFREKALKAKLGFDKKNPPPETKKEYVTVGNYLFLIKAVPGTSPQYESVINTLVRETPTSIITKRTGELIKLQKDRGESLKDIYDLQKEKKGSYIGIEDVKKRLEDLDIDLTKPKLTYYFSNPIPLIKK